MSPRKYDLGRRRRPAEATRERILEATRAIFGGKGDLDRFSMEAVAAKAGVSRMTVYNQFHSQGALLEALADHLAARAGMRRIAEAFVEPHPDGAVRAFVGTFVRLWASDRVVLRRLRAMGVLVPSLYRKVRDRDEWRREAARNLLANHASRLPPGRGGADRWRTDLLAAATSFETFDALCDDDRTPEELSDLLAEAVLRAWGVERPRRPTRSAAGRRGGRTER